MPVRCPACTEARRPRSQLRAYFRSAERLARELGLDAVATAASAAIATLDANEAPRCGTSAGKAARVVGGHGQ